MSKLLDMNGAISSPKHLWYIEQVFRTQIIRHPNGTIDREIFEIRVSKCKDPWWRILRGKAPAPKKGDCFFAALNHSFIPKIGERHTANSNARVVEKRVNRKNPSQYEVEVIYGGGE